MQKFTASVVGGGGGGRLSLTGLAASERFELVAAADLRPEVCEQLKQAYSGLQTFTTHQEMFQRCPTDVVCVSTFPTSHRAVTFDALRLPLKGILVEKPLADRAADGRAILEAIRARKLPVAVPHGLLVLPHAMEIVKKVRGGEIGQLVLVEIECGGWDLMNAGIHWIDYFVTLIGNEPIDHVMALCDASTRTYRDGLQVETLAVTQVQTRSGIRCVMTTGDHVKIMREGKGTLFRLIGTKGMIEFWGWENAYLQFGAQHPEGRLITVPYEKRGVHQIHLENLAAEIDREGPDYAIADGSLRALEICEAAYLSSRHRCKIDFPFESFQTPAENGWIPGLAYAGSGGGRDGRKL